MIRPRMSPAIVAVLLIAITCGGQPSSARAAAIETHVSHEVAIQARDVALRDPRVVDRLALRPWKYDVEVRRQQHTFSFEAATDDEPEYSVMWSHGRGTNVTAYVDGDLTRVVRISGQAMFVMPDPPNTPRRVAHRALGQALALCMFALLIARAPVDRRRRLAIGVPLVGIAAVHVFTVANLIPRDHIRLGNGVILILPAMLLAIGAWLWLWVARRSPSEWRAAPRLWLPAALLVATAMTQGMLASMRHYLVDVAFASAGGARLMSGAVTVYGNLADLPGVVAQGDTYGPLLYLAYVPAVRITDDLPGIVIGTNFVAEFLVALILFLIGRQRRDVTCGLWLAAAWATCPVVIDGVVNGRNDVIVAIPIACAALFVRRPIWRGVLIGAAAMTKFLPLLLLAAFAVRSGERRLRSSIAVVGSCLATVLAVLAMGTRGGRDVRAFLDSTVSFQSSRDPLSSWWGFLDWEAGQYVALGALAIVGAWLVVTTIRRRGLPEDLMLLGGATVLALSILALRQYWGTYVTWLLPLALVSLVPQLRQPIVDAQQPTAEVARAHHPPATS